MTSSFHFVSHGAPLIAIALAAGGRATRIDELRRLLDAGIPAPSGGAPQN